MRIAIAGFGTESSTFSRHTMLAEHFSVHRGDELLGLYDLAAWVPDVDVEWIPVMRTHGGAGGPMDPAAFDAAVDEIVSGIAAAGALDGVYLDLHGAAHVADRDRAEEALVRGVRAAVGPDTVISVSMDTHGNFSEELADLVDLALCFRHAPHIDAWATRERAVQQLVRVLGDERGKPFKAYVRVPVLLPGERTSTLVEPAKTVFGRIEPAIEEYGVVDASLWVGFAWADEPRNAAAVLVTGYDVDAVTACASELATAYWDARRGFVIVSDHSGSWDEALDFALTSPPAPLWITDSGDNVTAGSAGDITFALARTLERTDVTSSGKRILFAGMTDPESVRAAVAAGVGGTVERPVGAVVDDRYAGPVERAWTVSRLVEGINEGEGVVGAVLSAGTVDVMVQLGRSYFVDPAVIGPMTGRRLPNHAYIPTDGYDVVVPKNGYLFPDQTEKAGTWFMAITPGGTDLDPDRLDFQRVWRPIWPLDTDFEADLTPVLLPRGESGAGRRFRVAICGFGIESSTFSEHVTRYDDYVVQREDALVARYDLDAWVGPAYDRIDWIGTMNAHAGAGGPVDPADYDRIEDEIVARLAAVVADGPVDGVYVDLHGAAHVIGRTRTEEHLLRRVRETVGDDCVISMSMDPHGNFSEELASLVDLATAHRHAPHIDNWATRERAIVTLVEVLEDGRKPLKAWVRVPVLLPGERTSTVDEAGARVFLSATAAAETAGVLDTSIWVGFAWADEDRNAGAVMVTGYDEGAVTATAETLARRFWDAREDFRIVIEHSGSWSEALDFVEAGAPGPVWITDSGDNVTAGGSGDVTFALRETLARPAATEGRRWLFSGIVDPAALAAAVDAGVGGTLDRSVGAVVDARFGDAVPGPWTVVGLIDGQHGEGVVGAVLELPSAAGTVHVSLHGIRIKFTSPDDPSLHTKPGQVWHDLSSYDVVVVKNGYLFPGQAALATSSFMALTPGGTDLDFDRLPFEHVWRPVFPLDRGFEADLSAVLVPVVGGVPARQATASPPSPDVRGSERLVDLAPRVVVALTLTTSLTAYTTDAFLPGFPSATADLDTSASVMQLSLTAVLVGVAVGQLGFGPLSDRFGRRWPLVIGAGVSVVASVVAATAPNVAVLLIARLAQGLAGSSGSVIGKAIVRDRTSGADTTAVLAVTTVASGALNILAPVLGGVLAGAAGWRGPLWFIVAANVVVFVLVLAVVPETHPEDRRQRARWGGLGDIVLHLRNRGFVVFVVIQAGSYGTLMAYVSSSPFVYQQLLGFDASTFGVLFAVNATFQVAVNFSCNRWLRRFGSKRLVAFGLGLSMIGAAATATAWTLGAAPLVVAACVTLSMAPLGLNGPNIVGLALNQVDRATGSASATIGFAQFVTGALVSPLVGAFGTASVVPASSVMIVLAGSALTFLILSRRGARMVQVAGDTAVARRPG